MYYCSSAKGEKYPLHRPGFFTRFFVIFASKQSYFEVLIKLKNIGHTICDPYQIFGEQPERLAHIAHFW